MPSHRLIVMTTLLASFASAGGYAQTATQPLKHAPQPTTAAITPADLMTRLYIFADDSMMGREVGTEYNLKGTAYIEREVRRMGLQPAGDSGTFFQNLPIVNTAASPMGTLSVDGATFTALKDFVPRDNSVFGKVRPLDGTQDDLWRRDRRHRNDDESRPSSRKVRRDVSAEWAGRQAGMGQQ